MPVRFTLTRGCTTCGAQITWEDERPRVLIDQEAVAMLETARRFVEEHPTVEVGDPPRPDGVRVNLLTGQYYVDDIRTRYIECPACSGRIYVSWGDSDDGNS